MDGLTSLHSLAPQNEMQSVFLVILILFKRLYWSSHVMRAVWNSTMSVDLSRYGWVWSRVVSKWIEHFEWFLHDCNASWCLTLAVFDMFNYYPKEFIFNSHTGNDTDCDHIHTLLLPFKVSRQERENVTPLFLRKRFRVVSLCGVCCSDGGHEGTLRCAITPDMPAAL